MCMNDQPAFMALGIWDMFVRRETALLRLIPQNYEIFKRQLLCRLHGIVPVREFNTACHGLILLSNEA